MRGRAFVFVALLAAATIGAAPAPPRIAVVFDPALGAVHGRLLVFAAKAEAGGRAALEPSMAHLRDVEIIGTEVDAAAGATIEIPAGADAFPTAVSALQPGRYRARAELDVEHRVSYDGSQPGDPVSADVTAEIGAGTSTTIVVRKRMPPRRVGMHAELAAAIPGARFESFVSPSLSRFAGRAITMSAFVVPPPGYADTARRFATVYVVDGFGASGRTLEPHAASLAARLKAHGGTELFYVYLNPHVPLGHSVFADSVNNGPWGHALTAEFIPYLERRWRMRASERARFLTGHSSGGWATMWLQLNYPSAFGGTWSTSPDPLDFHDFTGPDLVDDPAGNMYHDRAGRPYMLVRIAGKDVVPLRDFVLQERALGAYGGQFASFDAVFSPRGDDGRPAPLFDRVTGQLDPRVVHAWEARYDIVAKLRREWPALGPRLRGKLHVVVGDWDTFQLERGVMRLRDALAALPGSDAEIEIVPHRTHMDLYAGPNGGLAVRFDREMTAAAHR